MSARVDNKNTNNSNSNNNNNNSQQDPKAAARNKLLKEFSKNETKLKAELHQLELARKQYENTCKHEIQKVVNRYTNRIAKHHFYIDTTKSNLINGPRHDNRSFENERLERLSDSTQDSSNYFFVSHNRILTGNKREPIKATLSVDTQPITTTTTVTRLPSAVANKTSNSKTPVNKLTVNKVNENNNNNMKSNSFISRESTIILPSKPKALTTTVNKSKKNVSWNKDLFNDANSVSSFNDYDSDSSKPTQSTRVKTGKNKPLKGLNNSTNDNINQFLNSLRKSDSGFYTYVNSKGEAMCAGYDNFGNLNKFNSLNQQSTHSFGSPITQSSFSYFRDSKKTVINHFENPFDFDNPRKKPVKKGYDDDEEFLKSSLLFSDSIIYKTKSSLNSDRSDDDDDENKELFNKIFKAQNTRSLTFKNLAV